MDSVKEKSDFDARKKVILVMQANRFFINRLQRCLTLNGTKVVDILWCSELNTAVGNVLCLLGKVSILALSFSAHVHSTFT